LKSWLLSTSNPNKRCLPSLNLNQPLLQLLNQPHLQLLSNRTRQHNFPQSRLQSQNLSHRCLQQKIHSRCCLEVLTSARLSLARSFQGSKSTYSSQKALQIPNRSSHKEALLHLKRLRLQKNQRKIYQLTSSIHTTCHILCLLKRNLLRSHKRSLRRIHQLKRKKSHRKSQPRRKNLRKNL